MRPQRPAEEVRTKMFVVGDVVLIFSIRGYERVGRFLHSATDTGELE